MKSKLTIIARILFIVVLLFSIAGIVPVDVKETKAAITVTSLGTAQEKDTIRPAISGLDWNAGDVLIICLASDTAPSVLADFRWYTAAAGWNNFDSIDVQAENSGQAVATIAYAVTTYATVSSNGAVHGPADDEAKAIAVYKVTGLADSPLDATNTNTGDGTDASTGSSGTLSQDDEIVFCCTAVEDEVDDAHGTWTTGTGYASGNEQFDATNGGGDASNIQVHSVARIVTDGTSQAYQGIDAGHDSTDWAACIATYKMESGTPSLTNTPSPSSKDFGTVSEQTTYYCKGTAPNNPVVDGDCTWTITNDGSIAIDVNMKSTDFTGGVGWNLVSGTPGSNEAKITAYYSGQNPASGLVLTNADQLFYNSLSASGTIKWDFSLLTGTYTDSVEKEATITLTAVTDS